MPTNPVHFVFLCTRLADYFFACIKYLIRNAPEGSECFIVCYKPHKNSPYEHDFSVKGLTRFYKDDIDQVDIAVWKPDIIYVSGWADKDYNKITRYWSKSVPVILGLDNPWKGNVKQYIATLLFSKFVKEKATHLWVTGYPQYEFARRLGFPANRILKGLYSTDGESYSIVDRVYKKRILYVGRMITYKRPDWLADEFANALKANDDLHEWELVMIGNGEMQESLSLRYQNIPQIRFQSFIQPNELIKYYQESAVFCMPSYMEHWGVVVHEAAASGLALLLSDTCGAATEFLINGYNGFVFQSLSRTDFSNKLVTLMRTSHEKIRLMGNRSISLARRVTHDTWCGNILSVLPNE